MYYLGVLGKPIDYPNNSIFLIPHWQYYIKRNGTRRDRQCCYGSKRAATMLIDLTLAYISCIWHTFQRLFIAIAAHLDLCIYGGGVSDAFSHIPGPHVPIFLFIYYHRWELPVLHYQGIRVNYPYPFLGVIFRVILHGFIRKNYHINSPIVTPFSIYGKLPYFYFYYHILNFQKNLQNFLFP